ncbi:two-component system regulatory protein [Roseibacterium elongatum DSM 19469]|uniref:Two-component system regulatory protein n=1 Tax=Roseicyclus elongatus DSM 19469 TaxID=1294273 RepID=W8SKE9_9RHOB|nr:response regulator [Roseibacterium elongatum]AHM02980.1 two-component system regulatory protein [Roseibacterium elongatum DSM 19469]
MSLRRKVLIVEDEILVGMDLAMSIEDAGFVVSGPYKSSAKALAALEADEPDLAVLDLNLGRDETSEKVAERLEQLGRPFVFLTGYSAASHPVTRRFPRAQCLSKPVRMDAVTAFLRQAY